MLRWAKGAKKVLKSIQDSQEITRSPQESAKVHKCGKFLRNGYLESSFSLRGLESGKITQTLVQYTDLKNCCLN